MVGGPNIYSYTASGGITFAGDAALARTFTYPPSGGLVLGGVAGVARTEPPQLVSVAGGRARRPRKPPTSRRLESEPASVVRPGRIYRPDTSVVVHPPIVAATISHAHHYQGDVLSRATPSAEVSFIDGELEELILLDLLLDGELLGILDE